MSTFEIEQKVEEILTDDEMATLDAQDTDILLEEEEETIPLELKERILKGEYL